MNDRARLPVYGGLRQILGRYDRWSLVAVGALAAVLSAVGVAFEEHVRANSWMWRDHLLLGTWALMTVLLAWDIRLRRDLLLTLVGFAGGLVIEWWGTTTLLWTYFTVERPPPWILPAWPVAALAIDRLGRVLTIVRPLERSAPFLYWTLLPAFLVAMTSFLWPAVAIPSSWVVLGLMAATLVWRPLPHRDVCLFLGGIALGVLLETWGTRRRCWTYYSLQTPPPIAVVAHGFAAVAFSRGVQLLEAVAGLVPSPRPPAPGPIE